MERYKTGREICMELIYLSYSGLIKGGEVGFQVSRFRGFLTDTENSSHRSKSNLGPTKTGTKSYEVTETP